MRHLCIGFGIAVAIVVAPLAMAQDSPVSVQVETKDGVWRGQTGQQIRVVYRERGMRRTLEGTLVRYADGWLELAGPGGKRLSPVFSADIVSIEQLGESSDTGSAADGSSDDGGGNASADSSGDGSASPSEDGEVDLSIRPTFLLPLTGMVGGDFRSEEIDKVAAQADAIGPGQTIVLEINSGGGYVAEWEMIRDAIYEAQKQHRVVAWVLDGTSAACSTSVACDVIVMKSRGHMGSVTTLFGGPSAPLAYQINAAQTGMAHVLRNAGRSPKLAVPFKTGDAGKLSLLSYTKDPDTGDVTWYQGLEGEKIMNNKGQVLGFTAAEAIDCGLAIGQADTKEELGILLNQGGWREVGTGEKLHDDWIALAERCKKSITFDKVELGKLPGGEEGLRKQIKIFEEWIRWWDRAANACMEVRIPPKKNLEQTVIVLKEQLQALRRAE